MRFAPPLLLVSLALVAPLRVCAEDPAQFDASKQNPKLAPSPGTTDIPFSPERDANQRPIQRNDGLQDRRFTPTDKIQRQDAAVGDQRAPIDLRETRDKTIIERKDAPKPELKDRVLNRRDGEKAVIQPKGDQIKKYDMAERYQGRLKDAEAAAAKRQPTFEKRTTFDKINRFVFKRNGPGTDDGKPMVTTAGGGSTPPPSQDTYTKYRVDWSKGQTVPVE
jgi:hypothetical protein